MKLIAYLNFNNQCEEALHFYEKALDGTITMVSKAGDTPIEIPESDKNKIMHARLKFGEAEIYLSDAFGSKKVAFGDNIHLSLQLEDLKLTEKYFNALSSGGTILQPLQETYWAARFGMLKDKFGIQWMFNCELKK